MEHQKILKLLNKAGKSKFVTRKWNIVNDQSNANDDVGNEIIYNTEELKSNICDYNDLDILVKGDVTVVGSNLATEVFKNCEPLTKYITEIAEDLDLVMPVYHLLEYSSNYSEMTDYGMFCSKGQATFFNADTRIIIILNTSSIRLNYWETLKLMEIMEF